ncbi:MAG: hypothetical protein LBR41_01220 [Rickettsiales bacterium]|jgi:hypothetical protein|nr:hypothetical protein [Rickettsiales bacterium]
MPKNCAGYKSYNHWDNRENNEQEKIMAKRSTSRNEMTDMQKTVRFLLTAIHFIAKRNLAGLDLLYKIVFEPGKVKNPKLVANAKVKAEAALNFIADTYNEYNRAKNDTGREKILAKFDQVKETQHSILNLTAEQIAKQFS